MPLTIELLRVLTQSRMEKRAASILPSVLQEDLPTCAQSCVATSVEQTFSSSNCSSSTGLGCLCSHYNANGMTLGEVSLVCLNSNCQKSSVNETASSDAYYVCSAQTGAVTGTHTVLTSFATATAPSGTDQTVSSTTTPTSTSAPSSAATSASLSSTSMSIPSTLVTSTTSSSISSSATMPTITTSTIQTSSNISSTITTSSSTVTAASEPTSNQSGTLTSSQAVGVSLGAVAGLAALIALIFCCCCVRRRKQKDNKEKKSRHSFDFVDKSPGPTSTFPSHLYMAPAAAGVQRTENASRDSRAQGWTSFKTTINLGSSSMQKPTPVPVNRPITQWPMPKIATAASNGTEKWKPPRPPRPDSSATALTMFDEDRTPRVPDFPIGISSPSLVYNPRMSRPKMRPAYADHYTLSPEDMHHPSLSLEIPPMPQGEIYEHRLPSPTHLTPHSPTMGRPRSTDMTMPPTSAISYLPAYYTSNDSRTPILPLHSPMLCTDPMPLIAPKEPSTPPRQLSTKNGHMSYASVTTFESVDPDEITPPEEVDKRLSAVAESPVSCVRYPKVPRPSNQAIPRSPPQSRWTASTAAFSPSSPEGKKLQSGLYIAFSPSASAGKNMHPGAYRAFSFDEIEEKPLTLLTKRRGEGAQADLEQRLRINNSSARSRRSSNYSQPSAQQKIGLTIGDMGSPFKGNKHLEIMDMGLKSPLWEPELTPSKRGDDLFISVH